MKRPLLLLAASLILAAPALAQLGAPRPTPEQLTATFAEDQLSLEACGVPRNAADDYRPAPLLPDQTRAPRVSSSQAFKVDTVASGLPNPWALAFLPSGNMLVTTRGEGLRTVSPAGVVSAPIAGTPEIKTTIRLFGMHDVILDRDFATNRTIYMTYVTQGANGAANTGHIASAKLSADETAITDLTILKDGAMIPRRIAQAPDGKLFIITADIITPYLSAQSLKSPNGKVLRINTDGSVPLDNPFAASPDADPSIWALGFRDAQGLAFAPGTGDLWTIENHPRGGDELNIIRAGDNHGFPLISYGRDNDGKLLNEGRTQQEGLEQPVHFWTPSVAFSGLAIYDGDRLPGWKGNVFAGGLSGMQLVRLEMKDGRVVGEEKLLRDRCKRIRDVRQGPDGDLYVLTDDANGEILRVGPG